MLVATKKRKLALVTSEAEAWKPPAVEPSQPRATGAGYPPLRRYPGKALPTAHVKARMDKTQFGNCCVRADGVHGVKEWGHGNGSKVFPGEVTYFCHMCLTELPIAWWARLGWSSEEEAQKWCEGTLRRVLAARLAPAARLAQRAACLPRAPHHGRTSSACVLGTHVQVCAAHCAWIVLTDRLLVCPLCVQRNWPVVTLLLPHPEA